MVSYSRRKFERIRRKIKIHWEPNCMRHSFGSYHLAIFDNAGKTALQMGHRDIGTLFEYYRRAVRREDADSCGSQPGSALKLAAMKWRSNVHARQMRWRLGMPAR